MSLLAENYGLGGFIPRALKDEIVSTFPAGTHEYWMERALQISMNACGSSAPNPAVGCVIVSDGVLIAEGFTQQYRGEHAERMAMNQIGDDQAKREQLKNATVYVTLEPCSHFGSQPPCVDLFLNSPIQTIVIACPDPDSRVNGAGIEKLKAAGKTVIVGTLEEEAKAWHFPFLINRLKGLQSQESVVWIGKWAQTPAGYLADAEGNSKWITNPKSRAYTHWLRQKYDAILVGVETWIHDRPSLTVRDCALPHHRNPIRMIFDPNGRLLAKENLQALESEIRPLYVLVEEKILSTIRLNRVEKEIQNKNVHWVPMNGLEDLKSILPSLVLDRPLQSVLVEGGPTLLRLLMQHDMLDAVHQFIGPKEFDHNSERYRLRWPLQSASFVQWKLLNSHKFDDDLLHEWVKCF